MTKKPLPGALLLASLATLPWAAGCRSQAPDKTGGAPATDTFEAIAKQKETVVPGLAGHPAPKLPDVRLSWDSAPKAGFAAGDKIATQAQLDAELARMRQAHAPFLADLAPALTARPQQELASFDWRLAPGKNPEAELADALAGKGEWQKLTIPHYGGPVGKATAFYRTEIELSPDLLSRERLFLHFNAVDYCAAVYFNGKLVGTHEGLFDAFEFDVKALAKPGKNALVVRVGNEGCPIGSTGIHGGNYAYGPKMAACGGPGWDNAKVGWVCCPVGFGMYQRAWLEARSEAFVNDVYVRPLPDKKQAEVWVEVGGLPDGAKDLGELAVEYALYGQNFKATLAEAQKPAVALEDGEVNLFACPQPADAAARKYAVRQFKFTVDLPEARTWSPDAPWLHQIQVRLKKDGQDTDAFKRSFGMRSFTQSETSAPKGRFYLNGSEVRLRGANMMGNIMQCIIQKNPELLETDILLAKAAHMNFWRMTQQPCQEEAFDAFDRLGLMAQCDLPIFHFIPASQEAEALREAGAQLRLVRSHPSNALVSYINEPMDGTRGGQKRMSEKAEKDLFRKCDALIPAVAPGQVRKWVDGDYQNLSEGYSDHHCYNLWYWRHCLPFSSQYNGAWTGTRAGWMHGNGEFGSEGVDSADLMRRRYPKEWLGVEKDGQWRPDGVPCQANRPGFARWMPPYKTMEEWCGNSREHQRAATLLQTEALRRDPLMNSTAIHLLVDAWPAGWLKTVVDCERKAKPAYFAFREAQTPLAVNLRPDHFYGFSGEAVKVAAFICNDTQEVPAGATLRYQVEMGGKIVATGESRAQVVACEPVFQGWLEVPVPQVAERAKFVLRVGLFDAGGKLRHDSAVEMEAFPAADKSKKLQRPGGLSEYLSHS